MTTRRRKRLNSKKSFFHNRRSGPDSAGDVHDRVTSPRWTKACSYADHFPTRYFVLYFGWTVDLMSRSCTRSGHRGQRAYSCLVAAEGLCTNAKPWAECHRRILQRKVPRRVSEPPVVSEPVGGELLISPAIR